MQGLNILYKKADVAVVGAGLAGLTAASILQNKGYKVHVFEAGGQVGGRARTERVGGFQLDHGFHLLHTGYPEFRNFIDIRRLNVRKIYNGALVWRGGRFHNISHPLKHMRDLPRALMARNLTFRDRWRMISLMAEAGRLREEDLLGSPDVPAMDYFRAKGFSEEFLSSFFLPYLASAFLDDEQNTPSRLALFLLKMFNEGAVGLPENGIGAVAEQIAARLHPGTIHLKSKVKRVSSAGIQLLKGDYFTVDRILLATNPLALSELLPDYDMDIDSRHVTCMYFASDTPPVDRPAVVLNGEGKGLVNHLCVVDLLQPSYSPAGSHLIALHITREHDHDDEELVDEVMKEMSQWFGVKVNSWEHLKTYHIKYALPRNNRMERSEYAIAYNERMVICGDHLTYGSMNSAIRSGKAAAELLHQGLKAARKARPTRPE